MRSGATQSSPTASPKVTATIGADVYTSEGGGGNDGLVSITADEQVWGGQYTLELDNADETLNAKDYKGSGLTLNFGFTDAAGSNLAPLYVYDQAFISREGKLLLQLNCIDAWGLLSQVTSDLASASWNQEWQKEENLIGTQLPSGEPITQALIDTIKAQYGKTIFQIVSSLIGTINKTVVLDDNDGIINVRTPPLSVRNVISGVRQTMEMTKSYLLWKPDGQFHVIQPDLHTTVYNYDIANLFFSNVEDAAVVIPNQVTFWSFDLDGKNWISGTADNTVSQGKVGIIPRHYLLANMHTDARADTATLTALAEGALAKIEREESQGMLIAPMHCAQELFDKISIVDDRYGTPRTTTGYIHRIVREYGRGVYRITIQLGGVTSGYIPPGGSIPIPLAGAESPQAPRPDYWVIPKAVQGYHHDLHFVADDWDTVSWLAGTIKFYDGTTQSISAGNTGDLPSSLVRYIYFDLADVSPNVLKVTDNYLSVMTLKTGVVCMIQRGSSTAIKATVIPSYGKEPLITPDIINMTGLLVHDYGGGKYLQSILNTQISAGLLKLTASTVKSGSWYGESGVIIDATTGIEIQGDLDLKFTYGGSYPCYIYTGTVGDLVLLSRAGHEVFVYQDGLYANNLRLPGDALFGSTASSADRIFFRTGGYDKIFCPQVANWGKLGDTTYYWYRVYADAYYGKITTIQSFQRQDDIALIKRIGDKRVRDKDGIEREVIDIDTLPEGVKHIEVVVEKPKRTMLIGKPNPKKDKIDYEELVTVGEEEVRKEEFINMGALTSLALGAIKQLIERVEALEAKL